jgi:hypothetical protein
MKKQMSVLSAITVFVRPPSALTPSLPRRPHPHPLQNSIVWPTHDVTPQLSPSPARTRTTPTPPGQSDGSAGRRGGGHHGGCVMGRGVAGGSRPLQLGGYAKLEACVRMMEHAGLRLQAVMYFIICFIFLMLVIVFLC